MRVALDAPANMRHRSSRCWRGSPGEKKAHRSQKRKPSAVFATSLRTPLIMERARKEKVFQGPVFVFIDLGILNGSRANEARNWYLGMRSKGQWSGINPPAQIEFKLTVYDANIFLFIFCIQNLISIDKSPECVVLTSRRKPALSSSV